MAKSDMTTSDTAEHAETEVPKSDRASVNLKTVEHAETEVPKSDRARIGHHSLSDYLEQSINPMALHHGVQPSGDVQGLSPQGSGSMTMPGVGCVLYQPEIPGNTGTLMRLSACWNVPLALIGPLGFVWSDKHLKRASMDYVQYSKPTLHDSWQDYVTHWAGHTPHRTIAVVPREGVSYRAFVFQPGDHLIMGSESCGLPHRVISACDHVVHIPMQPSARSMNLAIAGALVWAEALFQTQHSFE